MQTNRTGDRSYGFTLIEVIVALALLITIGTAIYRVAANVLESISRNQWRSDAVFLIEKEVETIRNLNYEDVGIVGGSPAGVLDAEKTVFVEGLEFKIRTTIRNVDDPFDGTAGGSPDDTAPADYKLVEIEAECTGCPTSFDPVVMTTTVAPQNLETTTTNGSLFINVFDSFGQPVANADVHVENNDLVPTITIDDETNTNGELQLVDIPPSNQAYEITVTKAGHSTEQTYPPGEPSNPNPTKPHATVVTQAVTSVSFAIDELGTVNVDTTDGLCRGVLNIDFQMQGTKLIGSTPDVYKYSQSLTTDANGKLTINNVEWDSYTITNLDSAYDLNGSSPISPFTLNPNSTASIQWLVSSSTPSALRVIVEDDVSSLVDEASVRLEGPGGYDETFLTGRYFYEETDWSALNYTTKDPVVETDSPAGEIGLVPTGGSYPTSTVGMLESKTIDFGTAVTNFHNLSFNPPSQPPQVGSDSMRVQLASNNDNSTWTYLGPDGTADTYYESTPTPIHSGHDGDRYVRYKVYLQTAHENFTPTLEDIKFEFSSSCVPNGQYLFNGLSTGTYTITVTKAGFQTYVDSAVSVSTDWQSYTATLTP